MKPVQLVLPVDGHRIPALARFKERYQSTPPLLGEAGTSLGLMGTVGFLALLGVVLVGRQRDQPRGELLRVLGVLNLLMLMLGVVGGLGSWFALAVTPQIRTYARVNVVIGFLSLFALALLLERLEVRRRWMTAVVAVVVLVAGLFDQASARAVRAYAAVKAEYRSDAELVRRIESSVPAGAMIFQLPHVSFPEGPAVQRMDGYDTIRPYLHSRSLRWSQPAMRGRPGDAWLMAVTGREPRQLVETVSDAGFEGILVDRQGYADGGAEIEQALRGMLAVEPVVGTMGRLAFFNLGPFNRTAHQGLSADERERRRTRALYPLRFQWGRGFFGPESLPSGPTWRWSSGRGEIAVDNGSRVVRRVSLKMTAFAGKPPARLEIDGDLTSSRIQLGAQGAPISLALDVPPGHHVIRFRSDGKPVDAPNDPRTLIWRAEDAVLEEVP
jgi:phosphoglycerol transferase